MSCVIFFFSFFGQSGEASQWKVCYQQGLPGLAYVLKYNLNVFLGASGPTDGPFPGNTVGYRGQQGGVNIQ